MVEHCAEESLRFYPNQEYQFKWIRWYLEVKAELSGKECDPITDADIKKLYRGSIIAALVR